MRPKLSALIAAALLAAVTAPAGADGAVAKRITDQADLLSGYLSEGLVGDFLLSNGDVSVVIAAVDHPLGGALTGGNIIDAAVAPFWEDEFRIQLTMLEDYPRQALYDTVFVEQDGSGGAAVVTARGADSENGDLEVTTRYTLTPAARHVQVETTVTNTGASVSGYSAGDALDWGHGSHFVPGYGFDVTGTTTYSTWLGSSGAATCYGYAVASGTVTAHHGDLWSDTTVFSGSIPSGGSATFDRVFIVGVLGLASVSDVAHEVQGVSTGTVSGSVTDADTGLPIPGATVTCDVGGSATYTRARTDSIGGYSATLFTGDYTFTASVPSYLPSEQEGTISVSQQTDIDFALSPGSANEYVADTLTVVTRPIMSVPAMLLAGDSFTIEAEAPEASSDWAAALTRGGLEFPLAVTDTEFRADYGRWFITARVPAGTPAELYDLVVSASDSVYDKTDHSVAVKREIPDDFYFIHITDTHMPTHAFHQEEGAESDTTELDDMRAVIEDINLINPAFVLLTGDVVNEGELEDYLNWRSYTKAKRILHELEVPVYVVAGNHDLGGWESTPPPDGTSRRNWWKFFGWRRLYDPPPAETIYTQNYSFDYGGAHFVGLEAYDNYDNWRYWVYGRSSFTTRQMAWLTADVSASDPSAPVIAFYHYDFGDELMLDYYGIDCGLYGHIHRDSGSLSEYPLNIATDNVCDGERSMRLVRVSGGVVTPEPTIHAGSSGQNLRVTYDRPNDGTQSRVTAQVVNMYDGCDFEHGMVRFMVRADSLPYAVDGGDLLQTVVDGAVATCYVALDIPYGTTSVSVAPTGGGISDGAIAHLGQNRPNPARAGTAVEFVLAFPTEVALDVFDVSGRRVATLVDGPRPAGPNSAEWDLTARDGSTVASGVYFYRLKAGDETLTRKLIVVR